MQPLEKKMQPLEKILRWLLFSVAMALLPIMFNLLRLLTRTNSHPDLDALTAHGEVLLVAAGISAAAVGELVVSSGNMRLLKIFAGGSSIIVLFLASLYFADVSAAHLAGEKMNLEVVKNVSFSCLGFSIITGGSCVILADI